MCSWEQIQITIDFIEEHLNEEMRVEELAEMASLSAFYYQRLFSRLVKKPVKEYIRLRRMAKATEELRQPGRRILDVALELGFSTHGHFTRTFKDTFGMTPEEFRRAPVTLNRMTKPELLLYYTCVDENVPLVTDGIVLEITRKHLAVPEYFIGQEAKTPVGLVAGLGVESGPDPLYALWADFHEKREGMPVFIEGGAEIGASYRSDEEGYFIYFAGGQSKTNDAPDGYRCFTLTAGEYIVCTFEAEEFETLVMDTLYKASQYLFGTWLVNRGITTEPYMVERYATHGEGTTVMEIWVKPV